MLIIMGLLALVGGPHSKIWVQLLLDNTICIKDIGKDWQAKNSKVLCVTEF
jgi:hypothetical protein